MSTNTLLYKPGRGWLVFSGGNTLDGEIRSQVLSRAKPYGVTAYISLADDDGDSLMDDMEDLGARTGYFIDLEFDDPETIVDQLQLASVVVVEVGSSVDELYELLQGAPLRGLQDAYERGAIILFEGLSSNLFGRWALSDAGEIFEAFNWVQNAFIEPHSAGMGDSRAVQAVLSQIPDAIAINISEGSALALGQDGQVEIWGESQQVVISLGSSYST